MAAVDHALTPLFQHRRIDIRHHHASLRSNERRKTRSQVARPRCKIQHLLAAADSGKIDCDVLPQTVDTEGHQVIHDVVAARHRIEDAAHSLGFLFYINGFISEMGGLVRGLSGHLKVPE